jgi:hypothetical protein
MSSERETELHETIPPEVRGIVERLPIDSTTNQEFRSCVTNLIALGVSGVHDDFDTELPQHNSAHTLDTASRVGTILSVLRYVDPRSVTARDIWLGVLAASFHDRIEAFEITGTGINQTRSLRRGTNEHNSSEFLASLMVGCNDAAGREIFVRDDFSTAIDGIDRTVPDFIEFEGNHTVHQMTEGARAVAFALLLADVNAPGFDVQRFQRDGDRLLLEQFPYIERLVRTLDGAAVGTRDIILDWTSRQVEFARGRQAIVRDEIFSADISLRLKEFLMNYFECFDDSISSARERLTQRVGMDVRGLLMSLRETIFTPENDQ